MAAFPKPDAHGNPPRARKEHLRVVVRVRPCPPGATSVVSVRAEENSVAVEGRRGVATCAYDRVFGPEATQEEVYGDLRPFVAPVAQGVNCTVFAYGQTGTGKTHTMLGAGAEASALVGESVDDAVTRGAGIIPRAVTDLFAALGDGRGDAVVLASFMQLYNDRLYDLLGDRGAGDTPLVVRETGAGSGREVTVAGLSEYRVFSLEDVQRRVRAGLRGRATRATASNEASSRSHAILRLSVVTEERDAAKRVVIRRAKLNLVDLAGSEKWDAGGTAAGPVAGSAHAKELQSINKSLAALGNCIQALATRGRSHIPYRDSVLTRVLQDSLGGNTRTTIVATVSSLAAHADETLSTLAFADRARLIMARVRVNEVVDDAVRLARALREIERLRGALDAALAVTGACPVCSAAATVAAVAPRSPVARSAPVLSSPDGAASHALGGAPAPGGASDGRDGGGGGAARAREESDDDDRGREDGEDEDAFEGSSDGEGGGLAGGGGGGGGLSARARADGLAGVTRETAREAALAEELGRVRAELARAEAAASGERAELRRQLAAATAAAAATAGASASAEGAAAAGRVAKLSVQLKKAAAQNRELCELLAEQEERAGELEAQLEAAEAARTAAETAADDAAAVVRAAEASTAATRARAALASGPARAGADFPGGGAVSYPGGPYDFGGLGGGGGGGGNGGYMVGGRGDGGDHHHHDGGDAYGGRALLGGGGYGGGLGGGGYSEASSGYMGAGAVSSGVSRYLEGTSLSATYEPRAQTGSYEPSSPRREPPGPHTWSADAAHYRPASRGPIAPAHTEGRTFVLPTLHSMSMSSPVGHVHSWHDHGHREHAMMERHQVAQRDAFVAQQMQQQQQFQQQQHALQQKFLLSQSQPTYTLGGGGGSGAGAGGGGGSSGGYRDADARASMPAYDEPPPRKAAGGYDGSRDRGGYDEAKSPVQIAAVGQWGGVPSSPYAYGGGEGSALVGVASGMGPLSPAKGEARGITYFGTDGEVMELVRQGDSDGPSAARREYRARAEAVTATAAATKSAHAAAAKASEAARTDAVADADGGAGGRRAAGSAYGAVSRRRRDAEPAARREKEREKEKGRVPPTPTPARSSGAAGRGGDVGAAAGSASLRQATRSPTRVEKDARVVKERDSVSRAGGRDHRALAAEALAAATALLGTG